MYPRGALSDLGKLYGTIKHAEDDLRFFATSGKNGILKGGEGTGFVSESRKATEGHAASGGLRPMVGA